MPNGLSAILRHLAQVFWIYRIPLDGKVMYRKDILEGSSLGGRSFCLTLVVMCCTSVACDLGRVESSWKSILRVGGIGGGFDTSSYLPIQIFMCHMASHICRLLRKESIPQLFEQGFR